MNVFVKGNLKDEVIQRFINLKSSGEILGIRSFNFEAPIERKDELEKICYRIHEVRGYESGL
ncbi:hypothetical protein [Hathewaya histolytica]|uniref:hypothetical protein n=1 Tax=Hathewaya histolytica TaxID=1498 RepID=UPI0010FE49AF|nr:hypothetical protein [Hathewaya histolytica]